MVVTPLQGFRVLVDLLTWASARVARSSPGCHIRGFQPRATAREALWALWAHWLESSWSLPKLDGSIRLLSFHIAVFKFHGSRLSLHASRFTFHFTLHVAFPISNRPPHRSPRSRSGCRPSSINLPRILSRVTPSQRAALAW